LYTLKVTTQPGHQQEEYFP